MTKRITPNAEHRIVDGEIVPNSIDEKIERGRAYSKEKAKEHAVEIEQEHQDPLDSRGHTDDSDSLLRDNDPNATLTDVIESKPGFMKRNAQSFMWLLLFASVIAVMFYTRPDMDWQVQKINELQSQVAKLKSDNQAAKETLQTLRADNETLRSDLNEAVAAIPQASLAGLDPEALAEFKQSTIAQLNDLKSGLESLSGISTDQLQQALQDLQQQFGKQTESAVPEIKQQLNQLGQAIAEDKERLTQQLEDLFAFKHEQQTLAKKPQTLKSGAPLNSLQIQQWIVEINTQWILHGKVSATEQQLYALEQAASLSDFAFTTQLARLIGKDLAYLQQLQRNQDEASLPSTSLLKEAIASLQLPGDLNSDSSDEKVEENTDGFEQLLNKFSQLISLKQRPAEGEIVEVNQLLMNDVIKQRLALMVDQLEWALKTQSQENVQQSLQEIKAIVREFHSKESSRFTAMLQPFADYQFINKQPLAIMTLDEQIQSES